jgi:hypothetical protein
MTEQIASAWEAISHFLTNKVTSIFVSGGVIVGAEGIKKSPNISLADYSFLSVAVPEWMQIMASFWIFTLIIEKYGFFKFVKWAWQKAFNNAPKT